MPQLMQQRLNPSPRAAGFIFWMQRRGPPPIDAGWRGKNPAHPWPRQNDPPRCSKSTHRHQPPHTTRAICPSRAAGLQPAPVGQTPAVRPHKPPQTFPPKGPALFRLCGLGQAVDHRAFTLLPGHSLPGNSRGLSPQAPPRWRTIQRVHHDHQRAAARRAVLSGTGERHWQYNPGLGLLLGTLARPLHLLMNQRVIHCHTPTGPQRRPPVHKDGSRRP